MMFYRYISENLTNYINEGEIEAGNTGFDYVKLSDEEAEQAREDLVKTKGFFILPSELFCNVRRKAANDENLNMTLEAAFDHIEESAKGSESEDNFAGLFDDIDVNSNKLGTTVAKRNANLVKLIEGVANMGLGNYKDNSYYSLKGRRVNGFNSMFAVSSIPVCKKYYLELKKQITEQHCELTIATIFSFAPNEADTADGILDDESFDTDGLDQTSRDFLDMAISDYNKIFKTNFDTSSKGFQDYYKDLSDRVKKREVDLLIVVNMFLTGFDATTLNTLWVDKNLKMHGLIQAFSRTNRILNSVKTFGNIVCFRDLEEATNDAIALFGDKDANGIVLLKSYEDYYYGCVDDKGREQKGYEERIAELLQKYPLGQPIAGEQSKRDFIVLFGNILRLRNILSAFDRFAGNEILSPIDFQDYTGAYHDVYDEIKPKQGSKDSIMDDVVFEMELVKQVEVNIDYILMLVAKYHDGNCEDKEILVAIDKAIKSSLQLRSKKELIENFIATINTSTNVNADWQQFVREQRETDIQTLIAEEKLKPEETRKFVENAFRDGALKTTGTDVDRLMPPVSRFGGGSRDKKKQTVIEKLKRFFEKYFGLVSSGVSKESGEVTYLYGTEPILSMVAEEQVHYGTKKDN